MFRNPLWRPAPKTPLPASGPEPVEQPEPQEDALEDLDAPADEDAEGFEEDEEEDAEYRAFSAVADNRQVEALWLRPARGEEHVMLDYAWRRLVRYDGAGRALTLVFADCTVRLLGRKLGMLMKKLQNRKVEWVQMYDPARWPQPAPNQPIVTAIVVEFAAEKKEKTPLRLRLVTKEEPVEEHDDIDSPDEKSA